MINETIGVYSVPDGYDGDRLDVELIFDGSYIIENYPFGKVKSPALPMPMSGIDECRWMIANHPNGKHRYKGVK